jgi:hypothetical protein
MVTRQHLNARKGLWCVIKSLDLQRTIPAQGLPHLQLMATDIPFLISALYSALLHNAHLVASQLHHPATHDQGLAFNVQAKTCVRL